MRTKHRRPAAAAEQIGQVRACRSKTRSAPAAASRSPWPAGSGAADEAQHPHPGGDAGRTPATESSMTRQSPGVNAHLCRGEEEQVGRRLAVRHHLGREQVRVERTASSPVSDSVRRILASRLDDATQRGSAERRPATSRTCGIGRSSSRKAAASRSAQPVEEVRRQRVAPFRLDPRRPPTAG